MADPKTSAIDAADRLEALIAGFTKHGLNDEQRDVLTLCAAVRGVKTVADTHEWGALRWEDPLPVPSFVGHIRKALGLPTEADG